MRRIAILIGLLFIVWPCSSAQADQRIIVRIAGGEAVLDPLCATLGCTVRWGLGDPAGEVFLVSISDNLSLTTFLSGLSVDAAVLDVELDLRASLLQSSSYSPPPALYDVTPVSYFGVEVIEGYVTQPAAQLTRIGDAQNKFGATGGGTTVAVIDTGVDPNHPALRAVLLPGYDFTRNQNGGSEMTDVNQSTAAVVDGSPTWVNSFTSARLDQSTAAVVDSSGHGAFGHGTMTAGLVHLVAPQALILPLKSFGADGSGYSSDIIRAIYWSVRKNAQVVSMSFSMAQQSRELKAAINFANNSGVTCVASAGNSNSSALVFPAGYTNVVGVASTTNSDVRSAFSDYGSALVWVAAPGEGVVSTYPFGTYAAGWGTSFSAPLVSGTASLLAGFQSGSSSSTISAWIAAGAVPLTSDLNHGRIDIYSTLAKQNAQ